jgi:hypothetical protein
VNALFKNISYWAYSASICSPFQETQKLDINTPEFLRKFSADTDMQMKFAAYGMRAYPIITGDFSEAGLQANTSAGVLPFKGFYPFQLEDMFSVYEDHIDSKLLVRHEDISLEDMDSVVSIVEYWSDRCCGEAEYFSAMNSGLLGYNDITPVVNTVDFRGIQEATVSEKVEPTWTQEIPVDYELLEVTELSTVDPLDIVSKIDNVRVSNWYTTQNMDMSNLTLHLELDLTKKIRVSSETMPAEPYDDEYETLRSTIPSPPKRK